MREPMPLPISRDANRAPSLAMIAAVAAAATLIAAMSGAFGTWAFPIGARIFVFGSVIGLNALKWYLWYAAAARFGFNLCSIAVPLAGAILLNLTLPFELMLAYRALGYDDAVPVVQVYAMAVAIALMISAVIAVSMPRAGPPAPAIAATGRSSLPAFAAAAGVTDAAQLLAVLAEDHYLRLHLADGRRPMVLHRFGLAVADLAVFDGLAVHRGAWVARGAVASAFREGRKWRLRLIDGTVVPVSDPNVAAVRAAGLLDRRDAVASA